MLKEKLKQLLLREKLLIISGILLIITVCISMFVNSFRPLTVIISTVFVTIVLYNLYKYTKMLGINTKDMQKSTFESGLKKFRSGNKLIGSLEMLIIPLTLGLFIPSIIFSLIVLWLKIIFV